MIIEKGITILGKKTLLKRSALAVKVSVVFCRISANKVQKTKAE